jgi:hypothetical protein
MYFKINNFNKYKIHHALCEVLNNKALYIKSTSRSLKFQKKIDVFRMDHKKIVKLKNLTDYILSDKILDNLKSKFGKIYLINNLNLTINGYNPDTHRDGQGVGFSKVGLEDSEKTFKVVHYLRFEKKEPIMFFGRFDSRPFKFFKSPFLYKIINYFIENYIKKNFLIPIFYKDGQALVFDNNTWHSPNVPFKKKDDNKISKIYVAYEFSTQKKSALRFMKFYYPPKKYKTSINDFNYITKKRLLKRIKKNEIELLSY